MWCELLSEALATLWTSSVTSDPDLWLKWDPLRPETQTALKLHHGADNVVPIRHPITSSCPCVKIRETSCWFNTCPCCCQGPALLNKAVWSRCMLGVLSSSETGARWELSEAALLSLSHVTLGEWKERIQQLQDVSAVLWDNMAIHTLAEFR